MPRLSTQLAVFALGAFCLLVTTAQTALAQTDPCMSTCCSRGWNFYGEGNFSKLGVNGTSDCNCFDTQLTKCSSESSLQSATRRQRRMISDEAARVDNHCLSACCAGGHAYYGYGDYSRIDSCNCVMTVPIVCGSEF